MQGGAGRYMTYRKPDSSYWDVKLAAYLHNPIDASLYSPYNVDMAAELRKAFGVSADAPSGAEKAGILASGFERGTLPGSSEDGKSGGPADFFHSPVITHPVAETGALEIDITEQGPAGSVHGSLCAAVSDVPGSHEWGPRERFLYTHLLLRFKLAEDNVGGLGALWHRLPADVCFPDHSVWQHNALASAFCSTMEMSGSMDGIGMMVCSITPVQAFISRARKLRDYWTGSVILSKLAFEGIRWVVENLGPDHILYPSLIDQPMIVEYMRHELAHNTPAMPKTPGQHADIASFPNKFIFILPVHQADEIAVEIEKHILSWWRKLFEDVYTFTSERACRGDDEKQQLKSIFERQCADYWDFSWSAVRFAGTSDVGELGDLLPESAFSGGVKLAGLFSGLLDKKSIASLEHNFKGLFYPASHSLLQSSLASEKSGRVIRRVPEPGEKCCQCGEFESLHAGRDGAWKSAQHYTETISTFWSSLRGAGDIGETEFSDKEHLCSLCLVKRLAYRVVTDSDSHLLSNIFRDYESFPTTTHMALYDYFKRNNITSGKEMRDIADKVHENIDDTAPRGIKGRLENIDRYYAILLMDGDYVGKLVNGETVSARWETSMHPEIVEWLKKKSPDADYRDCWNSIFEDPSTKYRGLNPAVHAMISESLGDFSLYGVTSIVNKYDGRLIYAGGDDVCAVMPVHTVLNAARDIRRYYNSFFRFVDIDGESTEISGTWAPKPGKLSANLGRGRGEASNDISISAGILICHHKENLTEMIKNAHELLDKVAKEQCGRNACAIELRKRSGGSRVARAKWDNREYWDAFSLITEMAASGEDSNRLSSSLAYRLQQYTSGITAIAGSHEPEALLDLFFMSLIEKSIVKDSESIKKLASAIRAITVRPGVTDPFNTEPLLVALYLAKGGIHG